MAVHLAAADLNAVVRDVALAADVPGYEVAGDRATVADGDGVAAGDAVACGLAAGDVAVHLAAADLNGIVRNVALAADIPGHEIAGDCAAVADGDAVAAGDAVACAVSAGDVAVHLAAGDLDAVVRDVACAADISGHKVAGDAAVFYGDAVVVGDAVVCGAAAADRTADAAAADLNGVV